jgi:hypothetical protein
LNSPFLKAAPGSTSRTNQLDDAASLALVDRSRRSGGHRRRSFGDPCDTQRGRYKRRPSGARALPQRRGSRGKRGAGRGPGRGNLSRCRRNQNFSPMLRPVAATRAGTDVSTSSRAAMLRWGLNPSETSGLSAATSGQTEPVWAEYIAARDTLERRTRADKGSYRRCWDIEGLVAQAGATTQHRIGSPT